MSRCSNAIASAFGTALSRVNVCPLGSGAIAGSTLPLKRELVAKLLNFVDADGKVQLTQNSMDAVSDRDFAVEFCAAGALLAVHLSRLAEDVILWASAEFNFIKIADAYTTGLTVSSCRRKKSRHCRTSRAARPKPCLRQPDVAAHVAERIGPMTYNRDLQEDKERLFDTADTVRASTRIFSAMLRNVKAESNALPAPPPASDPALLATDLAVDYLVRKKEWHFARPITSSAQSWRWRKKPASR